MTLLELWDDIIKQRAEQAHQTPSGDPKEPQGTKGTVGTSKPMTAQERLAKRKADQEAAKNKTKDAMKARATHQGRAQQTDDELE